MKLPYEVIEIKSEIVTDQLNQYLSILLDIYRQATLHPSNPYPYLVDEEGHVYGTILEATDKVIKLLFFMVDLPRMCECLEMKDQASLNAWLQTVPLEYVPTLYNSLVSMGYTFSFPCPSIPAKQSVLFRDKISTRFAE